MRSQRSRLFAALCICFMFCVFVTMKANGAPPGTSDNTVSIFDNSDQAYNTGDVLNAIRRVESNDGKNKHDGDGGLAIGDFQIHKEFWLDSRVSGNYERCRHDRHYSEVVILAYWQRHCPNAVNTGDYKTLIRVFHGGPRGATKDSTIAYLCHVESVLTTNR